MSSLICPKNGCDLRGKPIDDRYFDPALHDNSRHDKAIARWGNCTCLPYGEKAPEERFYSKLIGIEDGTYDGVSWWLCPVCDTTWNRWTGEVRDGSETNGSQSDFSLAR